MIKKIYYLFSIFLFPAILNAGEIALTFDDAPMRDMPIYTGMQRAKVLVEKLKKYQVEQVAFFCVGNKTLNPAGKDRLKLYADNGHLIANHTFSHMDLNTHTIAEYSLEIQKGDEILRYLPGFVKWFRFPMLHEGNSLQKRDEIRDLLKQMNYFSGYVTVDNYDFYLNALLERDLKAGKVIDFEKLKTLYVDILWGAIQFYEDIAQKTLHRSPKHVLLLHENDTSALFIDVLIEKIREQGWTIISPVEAYKDPIANILPDTLYNGQGRVAAIAKSLGYTGPISRPTEDEEYLEQLWKDFKISSISR